MSIIGKQASSSLKKNFDLNLVIDQENDIVQILEGFYGVINHCLGIAYDILEEERSKEE